MVGQMASPGEADIGQNVGGGRRAHWNGTPRHSLPHLFFSEVLCCSPSPHIAMVIGVHAYGND